MRSTQFALACAVAIVLTLSIYGTPIGPSALGDISNLSDAQLAAKMAQEQPAEIRRELSKEKRWREMAPPFVRDAFGRQ